MTIFNGCIYNYMLKKTIRTFSQVAETTTQAS